MLMAIGKLARVVAASELFGTRACSGTGHGQEPTGIREGLGP